MVASSEKARTFVLDYVEQRFKTLRYNQINQPDNRGNTLLMHCCWLGDDQRVRYLLQNGADSNLRNKAGQHALSKAFGSRSFSTIELLLDNRADPNLPNDRGWTIMHQLSKVQRVYLIEKAMKKGGDPARLTPNDGTCWHIAARDGRDDLLSLWISKKAAGINVPDQSGRPPIFDIIDRCNMRMVRRFVGAGADLMMRDLCGCNPATYASNCNHQKISAYLARKTWKDVTHRHLARQLCGAIDQFNPERDMPCIHPIAHWREHRVKPLDMPINRRFDGVCVPR